MSDSDTSKQPDGNTHRLSRVGLVGTAIYLILLAIATPALISMGWIVVTPMQLNEVGDLLAGLFGPLAIYWLVLGYFLQGHELRNSVATLQLQAKELAASVEQQTNLVNVTREQLVHEKTLLGMQIEERKKQAQPDFIIRFGMTTGWADGRGKYRCKVSNAGSAVSRVEFLMKDNDRDVAHRNWEFCQRGWTDDLIDVFGGQEVQPPEGPLSAIISYFTDLNESWQLNFSFERHLDIGGTFQYRPFLTQVVRLP